MAPLNRNAERADNWDEYKIRLKSVLPNVLSDYKKFEKNKGMM
jgi:hypothetical protein